MSFSDYLTQIETLLHENLPDKFTVKDFLSKAQLLSLYQSGTEPSDVLHKIWNGTTDIPTIKKYNRLSPINKVTAKIHALVKEADSSTLNSSLARDKLRSELVRILFYMHEGYNTVNPWGIKNRPQYPERTPISVVDKNAGKEVREALEKLMKDSKWDSLLRQLLKAVKELKIEKKVKK